uniref:Cytosolic Fe-S cluster assembly factor NUBP2 homolog n=1 Tax=Mesocestoides corti TaxID=53468 RepID=A0A5K3FNR4_MESCO
MEGGIGRVRGVFVVVSGKGGVGKSTLTCLLAIGLTKKGFKVGVLDVDLCGPSIPRILGLESACIQQCSDGWLPVAADTVSQNLLVMSIGFLLPDKESAVIWRGPRKTSMIDQFLSKVCWGELDALIIDTPPGTSDEHISVIEKIREYALDRFRGAIVVTTPQRVSICDVRRQLTFCEKLQLPVLGIVENMSGVQCPKCMETVNLFSSGGGEALAQERMVHFLGRMPLDPRLMSLADSAAPFSEKSQLDLLTESNAITHILERCFGII